MKAVKKMAGAAAITLALASAGAVAHPLWMLPSEFNLSTDEGHWITVDATASHGVFSFDKPVSLNNVTIYLPSGERQRMGSYYKGQRRSVFDLQLNDLGTYKVELRTPERYMTRYVVGGRDTQRRIMANKQQAAAQLPDDARDVVTMAMQNVSVFYVSQKAPTQEVLAVTGQGFEMDAITHPSDIVVGESATFRFTFNGEPLVDAPVEVVPHGTAYRSSRQQIDLVTDAEGRVSFAPEMAGPHLLSANVRFDGDGVLADEVGVNFLFSFEAIPE
ncbi:DUF4198 domain-containing protein [Nitrincola iocasae]|jgi:uncharacterized GH25 family protein|uniref:DUF4198 domain-containing protein n=1 Tax=Nitrincola iocasae TaxID=2614693 RepID=A0A5J6LE38_9GAMM|nr:DUF4198 domain-containing protein [Nitrincola iocasae]QEW06542.1 DUF4198 domain-containing protein [Nitrincola iocasae]